MVVELLDMQWQGWKSSSFRDILIHGDDLVKTPGFTSPFSMHGLSSGLLGPLLPIYDSACDVSTRPVSK